MLALNHATTAAIIALTIPDPIIAIPLAFVSHFILDAIPHYSSREQFGLGTRNYYIPIAIDLSLSVVFTVAIMRHHPMQAGLLVACIVASTGPDYLWPFRDTKLGQKFLGWFYRFHQGIQWSETVKGIGVEMVWLVGTLLVISRLGT